jgi:hypothetical protein
VYKYFYENAVSNKKRGTFAHIYELSASGGDSAAGQ